MVVRQLRLMWRTVLRVAREPRVGREVGRLISVGPRSTMSLRLPWLPFRLIDQLQAEVDADSTIFEYGGGGSTLWFLDRGATVVTVEHDPDWSRSLRDLCRSPRWTLLERTLTGGSDSYVDAISSFEDDSFDVVVVDGRERARCALEAQDKVRPGGLLIIDDCDRERYASAIAAIGWPVDEVAGFAPAKPSLAYTAVLRKPDLGA